MTTATGGGGGATTTGSGSGSGSGLGGGALQISASVAFNRSTALTATIAARRSGVPWSSRMFCISVRPALASVAHISTRPPPKKIPSAADVPSRAAISSTVARRGASAAIVATSISNRAARSSPRNRVSTAGAMSPPGSGVTSSTRRPGDALVAGASDMAAAACPVAGISASARSTPSGATPYQAPRHCGLIIRLAASAYDPVG